ncbi:hypothetical protein ACLK19_08465 [Escherichia coli]
MTWGAITIAEPVGIICVWCRPPTDLYCNLQITEFSETRNAIIFSRAPVPKPPPIRCQPGTGCSHCRQCAERHHWLNDRPTVELSNALMKHNDINLILATGGPGMVKAAYSSGKPAIGVGAGNAPLSSTKLPM